MIRAWIDRWGQRLPQGHFLTLAGTCHEQNMVKAKNPVEQLAHHVAATAERMGKDHRLSCCPSANSFPTDAKFSSNVADSLALANQLLDLLDLAEADIRPATHFDKSKWLAN
jgi:hypothetical protein